MYAHEKCKKNICVDGLKIMYGTYVFSRDELPIFVGYSQLNSYFYVTVNQILLLFFDEVLYSIGEKLT